VGGVYLQRARVGEKAVAAQGGDVGAGHLHLQNVELRARGTVHVQLRDRQQTPSEDASTGRMWTPATNDHVT
jgi:hypothetical protein